MLEEGALEGLPGGASIDMMGRKHIGYPSVQSRFSAWEAGLAGFAERPLLGWGPANFEIVFGRHATGYATTSESHDQAHSTFVETLATTGVAGTAAWLALWGLVLLVPLRAARSMTRRERAMAVFVSAAAGGHLVQHQFLFDTATGMLLATLLFGYVAHLEEAVLSGRGRPGSLERLTGVVMRRWPAPLRGRGAGAAICAAAIAATGAGVVSSNAILEAADARYADPRAIPTLAIAEGIAAFPPLANIYRERIFDDVGYNWGRYRADDAPRAARLIAWAGREGEAAMRAEPQNWRLAGSLARMFDAAAKTDARYREAAQRYLALARSLSPGRAVFARPVPAPDGLSAEALEGGHLLLRWTPVPDVGYHLLMRRAPGDARWRRLIYVWDPARGAAAAGPCDGCRYRIIACRHPEYCSPWSHWPVRPARAPS